MKKRVMTQTTGTWDDYQRGIDYLSSKDIFNETDKAFRFFNGDQWDGIQAGGEYLPVFNIIKPIVKYKTAVVGQNAMEIVYRPVNVFSDEYEKYSATCEALNRQASATWERLKLNRRMWDDIREAAITGSKFRYFYADGTDIMTEEIDTTNILFADEQNQNIQEQPYLIIAQRRPVYKVRKEAKSYGASAADLENIVADGEYAYQAGDDAKSEVSTGDAYSKCVSLVKFEKIDGIVHVSRATRLLEYQKPTRIEGMTLYPIAGLVWEHRKGFSRGSGEVLQIVPNQIEINKTLYRNAQAIKIASLPRVVYAAGALENPKDLETVGSPLEVRGNVQDIKKVVDYLNAAPLSGDAHRLLEQYITVTRELAGASDIATGTINPEQASGTAIIAVKKSTELPISDSIEAYKQYLEDIALIWYDLWSAYAVDGLPVMFEAGEGLAQVIVPPEELKTMKIDVRIDVSPTNPFDKFAQEQSLENLLKMKLISLEEYVAALPEDAVMPKAKLTEILEKREQQEQQKQAQAQAQQQAQQQAQAQAQMPQRAQAQMQPQIPQQLQQAQPPAQVMGQAQPQMPPAQGTGQQAMPSGQKQQALMALRQALMQKQAGV